MQQNASLIVPDQVGVEELLLDDHGLTIHARTDSHYAKCPKCERSSSRIHGCYVRTLADLPWCGTPVHLQVRVKKFFCDESSCERRIFAERLAEVARPFARGTDRQREALEWTAFALGGEAGARLARELGLLVSPDTLLNRIRGAFSVEVGEVRVLGVDDFAFKKASKYGTILVDLERHKVVDLLSDRSSETLAGWLRQHPNLDTVSRDRSPTYAEGISSGAPPGCSGGRSEAGWHLMRSLAETLDEFLVGKRTLLKAAATPDM